MKYTFESVKIVPSVRPNTVAAGAVNGEAVDTRGFGDAVAIVGVGSTTGTPDSFTVNAKVQESADGSTGWTDISGAAIVAVTAADKNGEIAVSISKRVASLRYIRLVVTPAFVAGTSPKVGVTGTIVLGNPDIGSLAVNSATAN